nr:hypothetical protein [Tanacetum cinerariifolium]
MMNKFIGSVGLDRAFGFTSLEMTASKTSSSSNPINIVFKKRTLYEVAIHDGHQLYEIGLKDDGLRHFKDVSFTEFGESYPQMVGSLHASFTPPTAVCRRYSYMMNKFIGSVGLDRKFGFTSLEMTASKTSSSSDPINIVFKKRTLYRVGIHDGHQLYEIGLKDDGLRHFKDASFMVFGESYPQMVGSLHASFTPPADVFRRLPSPSLPISRRNDRLPPALPYFSLFTICYQPLLLPPPLSPPSVKLMIMALEEYGYQSRRGIRAPKK